MVLSDHHLNNGPLDNQTQIYHLNSGLVGYSNGLCKIKPICAVLGACLFQSCSRVIFNWKKSVYRVNETHTFQMEHSTGNKWQKAFQEPIKNKVFSDKSCSCLLCKKQTAIQVCNLVDWYCLLMSWWLEWRGVLTVWSINHATRNPWSGTNISLSLSLSLTLSLLISLFLSTSFTQSVYLSCC